jgi:hypothetical protein
MLGDLIKEYVDAREALAAAKEGPLMCPVRIRRIEDAEWQAEHAKKAIDNFVETELQRRSW